MSIDIYQPCPCHEDKKIKFCCGKSIVGHLNDAIDKSSSNQPQAALERINRAIEQEGPKSCLLTIKGSLLLDLGEIERANETVNEFLEQNPKHPSGLQQKAVVEANLGNLDHAVRYLQASMDAITGDEIPVSAASAFMAVGDRLFASGNFLAGRAHMFFGCNLRDNPQLSQSLIPQMMAPRNLPLFLHGPFVLPRAPKDVSWAESYDNIALAMERGQFRVAKKIADKIEETEGAHPVLAKAAAIAASKFLPVEDQVEAWQRIANLDGVDPDLAIEAMGVVTSIRRFFKPEDFVEIVNHTVEFSDFSELSEKCISCNWLDSEPLPNNIEEYFEGPPPRLKFSMFDRPFDDTKKDESFSDMPRYCGDLWLFGKQTDREARAEIHLAKDSRTEKVLKQLADLGLKADPDKATDIDKILSERHILSPDLRFSKATPPAERGKLFDELRHDQIARLLDLKRSVLDGKSIRESVGDAKLTPSVQALLVDMQHQTGGQFKTEWLDEARDEMGLDKLPRLKLDKDAELFDISIAFISRLDFESLDWIQLFTFLQVSKDRQDLEAGRLISEHILQRKLDAKEEEDKEEGPFGTQKIYASCVRMAHLFLAAIEDDTDKAIEHYREVRVKSAAEGLPVGMLLVEELNYRMDHGITENVDSLLETITTRHINEDGVREAMAELLQQVRMAAGMQQGEMPMAAAAPAPAASQPSIIQSSDSGTEESGSSGLWIPE